MPHLTQFGYCLSPHSIWSLPLTSITQCSLCQSASSMNMRESSGPRTEPCGTGEGAGVPLTFPQLHSTSLNFTEIHSTSLTFTKFDSHLPLQSPHSRHSPHSPSSPPSHAPHSPYHPIHVNHLTSKSPQSPYSPVR
eukprot:GHVN01085930.1.p1 GENE.GHVN01085930.1~~GHVN01085930.1.p1  ORF type:complete len:146 (-),score=76.39 GHVN01085930.1:669-1076(-)